MKKYLLSAFVSVMITIPGGVHAQETPVGQQIVRPEVAESVKAYEGAEGAIVWTLRYGKPSEGKMIVQITDIDHPWNQKIQLMNVDDTGAKKYIHTLVDGKKFTVIFLNENGWGELTLPGNNKSIPIYYSKTYSSAGNAQAFLTDYLASAE